MVAMQVIATLQIEQRAMLAGLASQRGTHVIEFDSRSSARLT
jgi:hypothetical protein